MNSVLVIFSFVLFFLVINMIPAYAESVTLTKTHSYRLVDDNNAPCGDAVSSGTVYESGSAFFTRYVVYYTPIRCNLSVVEWDISSIPSGATVSGVSVRGTGSDTGATSCDVMSFPNQRSSYTDSQLVSRLASNTDRIADNSSVCTSSGMVSLGTDAITYVQSQIDNGITTVTMGAMYDDRSINERRQSTVTSTSELTITYTAPAQDTTPPVITLSGDNPQTVEFGNSYSELGATCTDDVDGNISNIVIDNTGVDASVIGTYNVTYDCADSSENNAMQVTRIVNIVDTTPPIITLVGDNPQTISIGSGYAELGATTDDGSQVTINSGSFADSLGSYSIFYDSVDAHGNNAVQVVRTVNVIGPTPTLTAPDDITAEATGQLTTVNLGTATATDNSDPNPVITNDAPDSFPVGLTSVTWTATNSIGNQDTKTQTVTIQDTTPPTLNIPSDITAEATGEQTTVSIGTATGSDLVDSNPTVTNNAPNLFSLGVTSVIWTPTDSSGNSASAIQTITIQDTTPFLTIPDNIVIEATGEQTTVNIGVATVTDLVDDSVTIANDAPSSFPLGSTSVIWTATDDSGNESSATQTVTLQDTTPPAITPPADITLETTGQSVPANLGTATASDLVDANPTITNNAPDSFPIGITTIIWTATDDSGNESSATQTLTNPNPSPPVIRERQDNVDPLKDFEQFVDDQGGFYFGLGLFPMLTMIIGFLAGKKTVRIFTLIVLFLMGIFHASGLFVYPDWYWAMSLLLGTVLVLGRQKSD